MRRIKRKVPIFRTVSPDKPARLPLPPGIGGDKGGDKKESKTFTCPKD